MHLHGSLCRHCIRKLLQTCVQKQDDNGNVLCPEDAAFLTRPEIFSVNMLWFLVYVPHTHMHFILYPRVSYGCVHLGFLFLWMCPKVSVENASLENKSLLASSLQVSLLSVLWWVKQKNTDFIQFCNRTPINTAVRGNSSSLLGWMVKNGSHIWRWS